MKEIEATRMKLAAMELVEGTEIKWWTVLRCAKYKDVYDFQPVFDSPYGYELALGIIEGKPVWEGDELYYGDKKTTATAAQGGHFTGWSWLPPKPKTAPVYLLVDDIEYWKKLGDFWDDKSTVNYRDEYMRKSMEFYAACRKTLEGLK